MTAAPGIVDARPATRTHEGGAASAWLRVIATGPLRRVEIAAVGARAAYLRDTEGGVIALEDVDGVRLPNAVALDPSGPRFRGLTPGVVGRIGRGRLCFGQRTIALCRWWDPRPAVGPVDADGLRRQRDALPATVPASYAHFGLHTPVAGLWDAARRGESGDLASFTDDLLGRGPGSTPAGDDVLAGLLATLRVLSGPPPTLRFARVLSGATLRATHRTTALSATLLHCAAEGAVVEPVRRVLIALAGATPLGPSVAALRRVGHTSGADLLTGIAIAVDLLISERTRA